MTTTITATPLPADLETLMRGLRLPHARAIAAEVLATARSQRCDPNEVVKALLAEEVAGRARSMLASRRKAAGFPTGKAFDAWGPGDSRVTPNKDGDTDPVSQHRGSHGKPYRRFSCLGLTRRLRR